jgi:hypothetical protein
MNRRVFLRETALAAGVVACGAGGLGLRCWHARRRIVQELMDNARPVLDKFALEEQDRVPPHANAEMKRFFDGIILNCEGFLGEISQPEFRKKLSKIRTTEERHRQLLAVYYRRVEDAAKIADCVKSVAREIGTKLDQDWNDCRKEIAVRWEQRINQGKGPRFDADEFGEQVASTLRLEVEQAVHRSRRVTDEPAWRGAIRSLGAEALLAGDEITLDIGGAKLRLPEWVAKASRETFGKVLDFLGDPHWDCQKTITARLAWLGNETAAAFEKEIRRRLNDLHFWREEAIRLAGEQYAAERIGFFGDRG